jgi:hypothetical protein
MRACTDVRAQVACELLCESSTFVPGEDAKDLLTAVTASTRVLLTSACCRCVCAVLVSGSSLRRLLTHAAHARAVVHNVMLKKRLDSGACASVRSLLFP